MIISWATLSSISIHLTYRVRPFTAKLLLHGSGGVLRPHYSTSYIDKALSRWGHFCLFIYETSYALWTWILISAFQCFHYAFVEVASQCYWCPAKLRENVPVVKVFPIILAAPDFGIHLLNSCLSKVLFSIGYFPWNVHSFERGNCGRPRVSSSQGRLLKGDKGIRLS
jgi:hypothetical protein